MHLKQTRQKSGKISLSIVESWWDSKKKQSRQKTVKTLGFLEDLAKQYPDPVAWGKQEAQRLTQENKIPAQSINLEIHPSQKINKKTSNRKNIGSAALLSIYNALGIQQAIRNFRRDKKSKYDLNAITRLLVCERVINPSSKLSAYNNKNNYFFRTSFSEDDMYRALDELADVKDTVISAMNHSISSSGIRDMSAVYYDVTNYYFETDDEDDLRKRGVSKEHRPNPIVQMGLLQDKNAIPISYQLFRGNTSDCLTMLPTLKSLKRDHKLDRVVVVADKGLNCSDNIAASIACGDGFVFSQSIRGKKSDAKLKKWVLDEKGYTHGNDFKIKSKQGTKKIHLKAEQTANGKACDIDVEVKYVAFWSKDYQHRARHDRAKSLEKAQKLIENPSAYSRSVSYGAARFVKGLSYNKETGEIADARCLSLDEKAIHEAEQCDGYYLIITSETDWSDQKIIDTYKQLFKIEETFKVTKSELKARPVYVWTKEHIDAHFLTCYISLVILRLLQFACGLSCASIRKELSLMSGTNIDLNWWVFDHRTDRSDLIADAVGLEELKLKNLTTKNAKEILAKAAKGIIPQGK